MTETKYSDLDYLREQIKEELLLKEPYARAMMYVLSKKYNIDIYNDVLLYAGEMIDNYIDQKIEKGHELL